MDLPIPMLEGKLVRRYKRFLADVQLEDGNTVTAHCPNTGAMLGCADPGSRVWLSRSNNPKRKYALTWEMVEVANSVKVGIHTGRANSLVLEAINNGVLAELQGYQRLRQEVRYGAENSRVDFVLDSDNQGKQCYVEVKSVTAAEGLVGFFPDAVTSRGTKHLRELASMVNQGHRAVLLFCVQRGDLKAIRPAVEIDPVYSTTLEDAMASKVEVIAYQADVSPESIRLVSSIPVNC